MEKTYSITINHVKGHRDPVNYKKVINTIHFGYSVSIDGSEPYTIMRKVELTDPDFSNFVEIQNVDKNTIIEWITPLIDEDALKAEVDEYADNFINPKEFIIEINND